MTLSAEDFIRRFLLHVLPHGFQRIRYYGFLGNRYRRDKPEQCRRLLGMPTPGQMPLVMRAALKAHWCKLRAGMARVGDSAVQARHET